MLNSVYFTICSKNYLAYALTLGRSLEASDPAARLIIFLADTPPTDEEAELIPFEWIDVAQLSIPTLADMQIRYSVMEFNTAIKAACFQYVFDELGHDGAIYLDPDIYVLRPLEHVEAALKDGANAVLTPHSMAPLNDGGDPDDLRLLRTGTYNLGFLALRRSEPVSAFLRWWHDRLTLDCRVALDEGIFVDQKWMDLAPSYIPDSFVLRHPGYNTAYWNLSSRPVTKSETGWLAAGEPLHFFHFSGVIPTNGRVFSKHQDRFSIETIGELSALLQTYLRSLLDQGHVAWSAIPYGFSLSGGWARVDATARGVFRRLHPSIVDSAAIESLDLDQVCNAITDQLDHMPDAPITHFTYEIWSARTDLRKAFDLGTRSGRIGFNSWLLSSGAREYKMPKSALDHLRGRPTQADSRMGAHIRQLGFRRALMHEVLSRRHWVKPVIERLPQTWTKRAKAWFSARMVAPQDFGVETESKKTRAALRPEVSVYGYFDAESGLGQAVRSEIRALRSVGCPAVARRLKAVEFTNSAGKAVESEEAVSQSAIHLIHVNADQVAVRDGWADPEVFDPAHYRIGYWAWELEVFPQAWQAAFDGVDEIWAPSQFVADAIRKSAGDRPVHVFPHCVEPRAIANSETRQSARLRFALPQDVTLFLSAFDFNSFVERKNPLAALAAIEIAQRENPNIGLVLKCHGGARFEPLRRELFRRARALSHVYIVDQVLDQDGLDALYDAVDGLISLHRSEGFGLTLAEAMACGKAVVATDYSGSADFLDDTVGVPVPCALIPVQPDAYPHGEGAHWADPDVAAAADALVQLAADPARRQRLGEAARERISAQLSSMRVGRDMADRIDSILATMGSSA